ncbi:MAG: DUF2344 domain-containing protein [Clostridia bacterium]|nr:DUF2344 domain-containing protein [Clostridia bacterium]
MLPVRVFFKKQGVAAYISHLDLQRTVFRAILRSGVRPCYTEGFNPHIKLAFAVSLSVYQESECEIFDFFTEDDLSYDEITARLKASFPECLEVIRAAAPVKKASELALADYIVDLYTSKSAGEIKDALSGSINVVKKSKKGDILTDVSPLIRSMRFEQIGPGVRVYVRCACGSGEHLNLRYITDFLGDMITDSRVVRTALLTAEGEELV